MDKPVNKPLFVENEKVGAIDIETYENRDGNIKVYALGFKTNLDEKATIYYIDKYELDSDKLVLNLVNELLRTKYSNVTFYCHNLGGYDIVFILSTLYTYNDNNPEDKYNISCLLRDDKILKVKVTKDRNSFIILDSYAMLPSKLRDLGNNFGVSTIKSEFPYKFAIEENLFYEGDIPSIDYYQGISTDLYNSMGVFF